ncbi:MAG: NusA-like transcription termination signal-binding factor [Candidatus Jordarchaeales archaeon]
MAGQGVKLTAEEMRYIALFETLTGATAKDCVVDNEDGRLIFVIKQGNLGLAIGKRGANIKKVRSILGKQVEVVEYSDSPVNFIQNVLAPAKVKSVYIAEKKDGKKVAIVNVDPKDKGLAIGKNGRTIAKARLLVRRHFGIEDIIIS